MGGGGRMGGGEGYCILTGLNASRCQPFDDPVTQVLCYLLFMDTDPDPQGTVH